MSRRFTAIVGTIIVVFVLTAAIIWWWKHIRLASDVTVIPVEGRLPRPALTRKIPADRYERCVNCDTKERYCPERGTGRYADNMVAVSQNPWACCPVGYNPTLVLNGEGIADNEIICVPK